jgi:tetratricopeptide (TPR) repeat protein
MWRFFAVLLVLSTASAAAQSSGNQRNETLCTLRVDVEFANKGLPAQGLRVQLLQGFVGAPYAVALTNSSGSAEFENLLPGDYRIEVSGEGIETTDSGNVHIENGRVFMSQTVVVRQIAGNAATPGGNSVNVHALDVPKDAAEELARGDKEMQRKNWKKAAGHFRKAVSIYPQYSSAYYNLSIAYFQLKQPENERAALQQALKIDAHFVPALVSLAHEEFADHKFPETMDLLNRAISADPTNVDALALRVRVDFMQGKYEETIADAQRVHSLPHQGYATVHYSAAAAYQHLNRIPEMIEQLKLFLKEDPTSPNVDYVRKTISDLENQRQ